MSGSFTQPDPLSRLILSLLQEHGRMHAYELTQAARQRLPGGKNLAESALYPALHHLLQTGLLQSDQQHEDGRIRTFYRIRRQGVRPRKAQALTQLVKSLNLILKSRYRHGY